MNMYLFSLLLSLSLTFQGGCMAQEWHSFHDEETAIKADLPSAPITMSFELADSNIFGQARLKCHTFPQNDGSFFITTYSSEEINQKSLEEKNFSDFFKKVLIARLFFNAEEMKETLKISFSHAEKNKLGITAFLTQKGQEFEVQGRAFIVGNSLHTCFYIAPKKGFDLSACKTFLNSLKPA